MGGSHPRQLLFPLKWMLSWLVLLCFGFVAPPDFHVRACANVCVSVYIWCVWGGGGGGVGIFYACVCASTLSCNGESELSPQG